MLKQYAIERYDLEIFTCSGNSIKTLNNIAFYNRNHDLMINVSALYLRKNKISYIHDNAFIKLQNLKAIFLDKNEITIINSTMFNSNSLLVSIELSFNRIHTFNLKLNIFPQLLYMFLHSNKLNVLDELLFKDFILKYSQLTIYNNTFICDCDMYWLPRMHSNIKSKMFTNNICSSSKLNKSSLYCYIKNKFGSNKCHNINLPTCKNC